MTTLSTALVMAAGFCSFSSRSFGSRRLPVGTRRVAFGFGMVHRVQFARKCALGLAPGLVRADHRLGRSCRAGAEGCLRAAGPSVTILETRYQGAPAWKLNRAAGATARWRLMTT